jgi:hypothetical protein
VQRSGDVPAVKTPLAIGAFLLTTCVLAPCFAAPGPSGETRARAKEAYDRGVEAHGKGDMQRAATEFARADALAPSAVALQAALDAAIDADDAALGSELIERSGREKASGALATSIQTARTRFAGRAGKVRVQCPTGSTCTATLDGAAIDTAKPAWAPVGPHTVVVQVDGRDQSKSVRVEPNETAQVVVTSGDASGEAAPAAAPVETSSTSDPPASRDGRDGKLPPIVFYAGAGATVLLAGLTTYFAIDAKNKHDEFETLGCARANLSDCATLKDEGQSAQTATNVSLVLTGLAGAATAIIGVAFTDWGAPMVGITPGGASVAFARRF